MLKMSETITPDKGPQGIPKDFDLPMMCPETKLCKFYAEGRCTRGYPCRYAHNPGLALQFALIRV